MNRLIILFLCILVIFGCKKQEPKTVPIVVTNSVNNLTVNSAVGGGSITNNGGSEITEKGLCWSTNSNPSVTDNKISSGSGNGAFTSNISGLVGGTKYYVRAYAINTSGIGYGAEVTFLTNSTLATLAQTIIVDITDTSANFNLNLQSNGGANVTEIGVCYGVTDNPTINDKKAIGATAASANSIYATITKLNNDTKYFVRPYAINSVGVSYGTSFTISTLPQRVIDVEGNSYKTVRIGNQIWMAENLRTTKFSNGDKIPLTRTTFQTDPLIEYIFNSDDTTNKIGAFYSNGVILSNKIIAPKGYHIPTLAEYNTLITYLGGQTNAATSLKSGIVLNGKNGKSFGWGSNPYQSITNSSGFSALQSGYFIYGTSTFGFNAYLWCADAKNLLNLQYGDNSATITNWGVSYNYYPIRCIKD